MEYDQLIDFYKGIYYQSLQDRENIQSKIKLYLFISITSISAILYVLDKSNKSQTICAYSNYFFIFLVFLLHLIIAKLMYDIFDMQDYEELPIPNKMEEYRKYLKKENKVFNTSEEILDYYARASSKNFNLNKERRARLDLLVKIYFILGGVFILWFFVYTICRVC